MTERVPVSKKLRFEIFKRDKFTCQYCGAKAPDVVLEADHINPVAAGGTSDVLNLTTSCKACNAGKGARLLADSTTVDKQREQLAELEERRQQIDMMLQWRDELEGLDRDTLAIVENRIFTKTGWTINESGRSDLRRWLKKFEFDILLRSIDESFDTYGVYVKDEMTADSFNKSFNKIPGVVSVIQQEDEKPYLRRTLYIQGIIRKRTGARRYNCVDYLNHLVEQGFGIDEMERRAKLIKVIEDFEGPYDVALAKIGKAY